jgi:hypothetical protein
LPVTWHVSEVQDISEVKTSNKHVIVAYILFTDRRCELSRNFSGSTLATAAILASMALVPSCLAENAVSRTSPAGLVGCWNKIYSVEQLESAINPQAPSLQLSFEICFFKSGKAATYALIPKEREGINDGFRWRLTGKSRLVTDYAGECGVTFGEHRTVTLTGCPLSGEFSKKCSYVDETLGGCK